jgi:hypothetical protein
MIFRADYLLFCNKGFAFTPLIDFFLHSGLNENHLIFAMANAGMDLKRTAILVISCFWSAESVLIMMIRPHRPES